MIGRNDACWCESGKKYNTNKSSYNLVGHRSGYTGLYYLLFDKLKNKEINFAEIGIEKNASTKVWRDYFSKAKIHGFEYDKDKIKLALKAVDKDFVHDVFVYVLFCHCFVCICHILAHNT